MSSLIRESSHFFLTTERLSSVIDSIGQKLKGRVTAAYVFGSASTGEITPESDIDLILIKEFVTCPFPQRAMEFADLFEVYPKLDILVYTPAELEQQLADSELGFWKSVRQSMKKIV